MKMISRYGQIEMYGGAKQKQSYCYRTDIVYPFKLREQIKFDHILHERRTDGETFWIWQGNQHEITKDEAIMQPIRDTALRANHDMLWLLKEADAAMGSSLDYRH